MATTKLYLAVKAIKQDGTAPIKIAINQKSKTAFISTGIYIEPEYWSPKLSQVIGIKTKHQINRMLELKKSEIDAIVFSIPKIQQLNAKEIKDKVVMELEGEEGSNALIAPRFEIYPINLSKRTQDLYIATLNKLTKFDKAFKHRKFDDIDKNYLQRFDAFLALTAPSANARNIHLRNLRAIFNDAIDNDITNNYPFRRFKIKGEPTKKRSYSIDDIRKIFTAELEPWQIKYRDFFKISFMLIGINVIDLCHLKKINNGRIEYIRAKTKKLYSIKIEPELQELLNIYIGEKYLLSYMDTYENYRIFYNNLCVGLKTIKESLGLNELTTYWARHTWATIASELDIPKDTIAAALGHGGNSVTDIYINFDLKKVDEANRKVLNYVLYNKK